MLNEKGGVIDDCIVYRFSADRWMLVVNAGTQDGDLAWLKKHQSGDVKIENIGPATGKLDLQGPTAPKVIAKLVGKEKLADLKFFRFIPEIVIGGVKCLLSRTGYTGEVGFEIYCPTDETNKLWDALMTAGAEFGIAPAGLGARDTLRLEAGLPLHGHEIGPDIPAVGTPWEFAINYDHDFIGKEALLANRSKLFVYPVIVEGRRKPGSHAQVIVDGAACGEVVSDILAVSLDKRPAGFIRTTREMKSGDTITLKNAHGQEFTAQVTDNPLWKGTARKKMDTFLQ
jgi:aminomethyltransferase